MQYLAADYLDQTGEGAFTGCESVTAVMLLSYLGHPIPIRTFVDEYLDKEHLEEKEGILYGPDPRKAFAGDPYSPDAMGCYAPVIVRALKRVLGDAYIVREETGGRLEELKSYIDMDIPVITWSTIDLQDYIEGPEWVLPDGKRFLWRSNEHCMLLVGYDEESFIFNDPWQNHGVVHVPKKRAEECFAMQYCQAVVVLPR